MSRDGSQRTVSLRRLLPGATFVGCADISVHAATTDSREAVAGRVFVAIRGVKADGHEFAADAVHRGACGLIVEHTIPGLDVPQCVVADSRVAHALLCQAIEGDPARQLKAIGITGTNGKTTTAILVKSVLEAAGHRVGLIGTIQQFDGTASFPATLTTPDPETLARLMRRMVDAGCSHVVMEVSSHALEQRRTAGIALDTAVFTNLTQDHLDYHGDLDSYRRAKGRLFGELPPAAGAVLNADDPISKSYAANCPGRLVRYAIRGPADFTAYDLRLSLDGCQFYVESRAGRSRITSRLLGEHNVYNCLAAVAVGRRLGIAWDAIEHGIERVAEIPGRLEAVRCPGAPGFHVLVDYAHTPGALRSVLASLRAIVAGKILCVFGAGGDRDRTKRPLMAQAVESVADTIVVTSDNPRTEDPKRIIREIVSGFRRTPAACVEPDRRAAIEHALSLARPGDCVLIAGKGHESYQLVGTERRPFDDRAVAAEYLSRHWGNVGTKPGPGTADKPQTAAECAA